MMESQVQPQESWTTASDKVTIPSSDSTSPSWNGTRSVDSGVNKEDGSIHAFANSMETVSHFLETDSAKDGAGLPSEEDPVKDQLSLAEASSGLNHSGTKQSGDAAQPVDDGKKDSFCDKTVTSPDSKALPDDVVTSHDQEPVRTQGGEGNGCDASGIEPMETEELDTSEGKEASDTVLDLKAQRGGKREDVLTASEPADRKASDDGSHGDEAVAHINEAVSHSDEAVSDEAVSKGDDLVSLTVTVEAEMGSAEVGASPRRDQLDKPVTGAEDGESDSVSASATSCADNSPSDRAKSPPAENSVSAQDSVGSEEKGDEDKEEDVSVCDQQNYGNSEAAQSIADAQIEEEPSGQPAHCADTTQSPPQSPDDTATRSSPKGSLPSETCRTDNIFEKFSSFGDLQSNATPPFGSKDIRQVEEDEDGGKGDPGDGQRCSEAPSDQMSSLQENQDDKEHPDDDSTAKDGQHKTDCRRAHVGKDIGDDADEDTHLKTQADTDGTSSEAFGQNRGESPEPCEEKADDDNDGETSDIEMGEDRDNVGDITESSHRGQSPSPSSQDALTMAGSELTKSDDRLNADQKDVCSDVSLLSHTSNQKIEPETENVLDTPPRPGSETDHSNVKSVEAENHPEQMSEDHQRDESTSQSQQKADTESLPKTTTQATSIDSNPVSNENDDEDYEDDDEENGNEGDGSTDFMKDETLFDMEERGTKEEDNTSVQEDSSLEKKEGDDVLKDGGDKKHQDDESDLPASDNEDNPDTPQFQLARTKTVKTYSRKVESKSLALRSTASAEITSESAAENQATPTGPNDSDSADGEESCSLKSDLGSPIIESAPSDSEEGSMNDDKLSGSKDRSLPYDESLMEDPPPPQSKPLIVSRITKALSSLPRDQDKKAGKFVLKLKPMALPSEARQSQDRDMRGESAPRTSAHTCDLCGKTFSMPGRLQRHKRHHQAGKHFYCDVCGKSFVDQEKLDFHHKVHTQSVDGDFTCDQCGHICKNWRSFVYHTQTHSGDGGKKHSCELCGHTLSSVQRLKRHMVHHKKGLHFCCFGCGKLFKTRDDLDRHSVKHKSSTHIHPHPIAKPVLLPTPLSAATATLHSTPVSRKRAAESVDEDQPAAKRSAVVRATRIQVSQAEREETVVPQSPDLSEKEEDWGSLEDTTSGTSTPAGGVQSSLPGSDWGRLRKSSRKRSHSRKKCSCCPSSPTPMASPSSSHVRHSKEDGEKRPVKIDAEDNPEKKRKISSDIEGHSKKKKKKKVRSDAEGFSEKKKKVTSDSESSSEKKKKVPSDSESSSEKKKKIPSDSESSSEKKKKIPSDSESSSEKKKKVPSDSESSSEKKKKIPSDSESSSEKKKKVPSDSESSSEKKKKIPSDSESSSEKKKKVPSDSESSSEKKKKVPSDSESSSEKKKKIPSDSEEDPVGKRQGTIKNGSEKDGSDRKKEKTVTLRECSIKLERAPSTSVQKLTPERILPPPAKPSTSSKPPDTVQEEEQKPDAASLDQPTPAAEKSSKKSSSGKKSGSDKRKKANSDYYGERKVKIHRTASEKMLPENLAKERGRRAGKEKQEPAAKPAKSEDVGAEKKASTSGEPSNAKYPCTMCGASFRTESDMKIHISKHLSKQSPKQPVSIESVAKSCRLSSERGSPDRQGFVCHRCGLNVRSYADLTKHMWVHSPKPHQCSECGLAFSTAETLQNHSKAHTKSKKE